MNTRLIEDFRPKFGITHSEWLFNEDTGKMFLGETAIRGGGVFISSDLIPLACGIDVNELLIRFATETKQARICFDKPYNKASGYVCFLLPKGTICRVDGVDKVRTLPCVHKVFLDNLKVGTQTRPITDKSSRYGPILVAGEDRAALDNTIKRIQETLDIEVQTTTGIEGIIW